MLCSPTESQGAYIAALHPCYPDVSLEPQNCDLSSVPQDVVVSLLSCPYPPAPFTDTAKGTARMSLGVKAQVWNLQHWHLIPAWA